MKDKSDIKHYSSISQLTRELGLPVPAHPLVALVDYANVSKSLFETEFKVSLDFYKISFKNSFTGQVKYGQGHYDFDQGGMAFLKPGQLVIASTDKSSYEGFVLYFHPDFIRNYALGTAINQYGFFSYDVSEALFLSAGEKETITRLFGQIGDELKNNIDHFSQDILVSHIELLLNYSNRFYNRQFITRKAVNHEVTVSLDKLLNRYFENGRGLKDGIPSVHYISSELQISQRYLSDLLRSLTGQNTQQYVQHYVIDISKDLLSGSSLSVTEIAYYLGFGHPQSFSKLFKIKTDLTPLAFRQSFN
jgi:AraC-like DNA-binding protein